MGDGPRLKRPCLKCDKSFQPTGRFQKLCDDCRNNKKGKAIKKANI